MKIKALTSFAGLETMALDEIKEVKDEIAKDLIRAGYAVEVKAESPKQPEKPEEKPEEPEKPETPAEKTAEEKKTSKKTK